MIVNINVCVLSKNVFGENCSTHIVATMVGVVVVVVLFLSNEMKNKNTLPPVRISCEVVRFLGLSCQTLWDGVRAQLLSTCVCICFFLVGSGSRLGIAFG